MTHHTAYLNSPIGTLAITGSDDGIRAITFLDEPPTTSPETPGDLPDPVKDCLAQLAEYFAGTRTAFDVKLDMHGTDFQQRVWRELLTIPFGSTTTYGKIAQALGDPKTVRAVGAANGQNPIAIIVPCHRVIGASGDLVGYAGGLWRKRWLLAHEGHPVQQPLL
jgi:methylated-DNA-[protein]-cysteine S-methyltransferase